MVLIRALGILLCVQICTCLNTTNTTTLASETDGITTTTITTPLPSSNSSQNDQWVPRVINGFPAKRGEAPYQVGFKSPSNTKKRTYKTLCGGAIIGPVKVLSAAHCFEPKGLILKFKRPGLVPPEVFRKKYAVAGNLDNVAVFSREDGPNGQWRSLRSVHQHPKYKFPNNDIAVVITRRPFVFNEYVSPIRIATVNTDYQGQCLISGYGRVGPLKSDQSSKLLLAHLEIIPKKLCSSTFWKHMDNFVCTTSGFTDVAQGDSGGPLICVEQGDPRDLNNYVLVGIVSGHQKNKGSFHTRVSRYRRFIEGNGTTSIFELNIKFEMYSLIVLVLINSMIMIF